MPLNWLHVSEGTDFSWHNFPFGRAIINGKEEVVSRIGNSVIHLQPLSDAGLIPTVFPLLEDERNDLASVRISLQRLFSDDCDELQKNEILKSKVILAVQGIKMVTPIKPKAFVDFYSGIHHASNVGKMFRPDMPPLLPNYRHLPVAYNGRANTVGVHDTVMRPSGQVLLQGEDSPVFIPTKELDFELEVGFFIKKSTRIGETIDMESAMDHILGFVLVNDWSARDIQRWEYQPLGPFLAKTFATSISPWIVLKEALEPFQCPSQIQDPQPLPHLSNPELPSYNIRLKASLKTPASSKFQDITFANFNDLYWSPAQQLVHQTSNGTPIDAGDLYASGTISSVFDPVLDLPTFGSLLELTWRGKNPIDIFTTGETRTFLEDGDSILFTGFCEKDGIKVGFGGVEATIVGANQKPSK